jgi:hypothetical protein
MLRKLNAFNPFERLNMSKLGLWFGMSVLSLARYLAGPFVLKRK